MIEEIKGGVRVHLLVQPGARKSEIVGEHDGRLKIKVKAPPVDGKANEAVEEFIAEIFGVAKKSVSLVRGQTSKSKVVEILGIDSIAAKNILLALRT